MRFLVMFLLISLCGCQNMAVHEDGLISFIKYQFARSIVSAGKSQLRDEFKADPSMSWEEYEDRRSQFYIDIKKELMIEMGDFTMDSRGHLKYIGKKPEQEIKKATGISTRRFFRSLRVSPSTSRIRIKTEIIKNVWLEYKQRYNGEWQAWIRFSFRF